MSLTTAMGTLDWSKWLYGLFSAIIGGGAGAATAGVSANLVVPNLNTHQTLAIVGTTFLVSGIFAGLSFLHQQPLPTLTATETTTQSVTALPSGGVTASKTVEKTTTTTAGEPTPAKKDA